MAITLALFGPERHEIDLGDGVRVVHVERWLPREAADLTLRVLRERIVWVRELLRSGTPLPRLTAWWGDKAYAYSGISHAAAPWPQWLTELRWSVSLVARHEFNGCLGNYYRDGQDCVGWHADDEDGLEPDPVVASLSLGEPRRFCMRFADKPRRALEVKLGHGDLLIMGRGCQRRWQHAIPRQAGAGPRISLTFRRMA